MDRRALMTKQLSTNMFKGKKAAGKRVLKLYTDEDSDKIKNWLPEKVVELSKDKLWKSCEILYWIPVTRKDKIQLKTRSDRYLFVFYNSEQSDGFLLNVSCRDRDVDFKKSWHLSDIKSLEFHDSSNIFKIGLEIDYVWNTTSNIERDEVVWVLIHICKYLCSNEVKIKSSMNIKALGSALTTNKTLSKFTLLRKFLDENMDTENRDMLGNDLLTFTPEETDAEKLFDELHWGGGGDSDSEGHLHDHGDPAELQKVLHDETDSLFVEICDFLLQWEEDDEKEATIKNLSSGKKLEKKKTKSSSAGQASVRETFELLSHLDNVDDALEQVQGWLDEQVEYLSGVQSQLFQIESENSGLETSWHNLKALKALITTLLNGPLKLDPDHEAILRDPKRIVFSALEDKTLSNTMRITSILVQAIVSLRSSLDLIEGKGGEFSASQWKQIQEMTVVIEHRRKLRQLMSDVCNGLLDFSTSLFKTLLVHKRLTDEKCGGKPVRRFSFTSAVNSVKAAQGNYKLLTTDDEEEITLLTQSSATTSNSLVTGSPLPSPLSLPPPPPSSTTPPPDSININVQEPPSPTRARKKINFVDSIQDGPTQSPPPNLPKIFEAPHFVNQIALAQLEYHSAVYPFFPLIDNLSQLSPSIQENFRECYVNYTEKNFFSILFKDMFRDLMELLPKQKTEHLTLSTMPKCLARKKVAPALLFEHPSICRSGLPLALSAWTALSAALRVADEVVRREHLFLHRTILKLEKDSHYNTMQSEERNGEAIISRLFYMLKEKTLKLVTSAEYCDGVEILAMLVSVNMLLFQRLSKRARPHATPSVDDDEDSEELSIYNINTNPFTPEWDFMEDLLLDCKRRLLERLKVFVSAQVSVFREKKVDLKKTDVFSPISRFPAFIDQLMVFSGSKSFDFIDNALQEIGAELISWVQSVAIKNEKYCDVILIHNFDYLVEALSIRTEVSALHDFCMQARQQKDAAEKRYVQWMVSYEFPVYASLASRINDLGRRATSDQLGLYIRREEVSKAVLKMDRKSVEQAITAIRKRLDKHFLASAELSGLSTLIARLWVSLRAELKNVFSVIERVANECYQIQLIVAETFVDDYSKKIA